MRATNWLRGTALFRGKKLDIGINVQAATIVSEELGFDVKVLLHNYSGGSKQMAVYLSVEEAKWLAVELERAAFAQALYNQQRDALRYASPKVP